MKQIATTIAFLAFFALVGYLSKVEHAETQEFYKEMREKRDAEVWQHISELRKVEK